MPSIKVTQLSKRFKLYPRPRHKLMEMLSRKPYHRAITALDEICFQVEPGECFGIIGQNGAGKSTLLRALAGISAPTKGAIEIEGRVSALLELNSGFHPEFTGRENLRLNASILGLDQQEVAEREQNIIDFAGLGEFIDLPVRTYSSGMYLRLGFAIATAVEPDVLLIDEALAVGDESFRGKCIHRIQEFRKAGKTIVIVSHDLSMIRSLCDRAVLIEQGRVIAEGSSPDVIDSYLDSIYERAARQMREFHGSVNPDRPRRGTGEVEITAVRALNNEGSPSSVFRTGQSMSIEIDYTAHEDCPEPLFGINIFRSDGVLAVCTNQECSHYTNRTLRPEKPAGDHPRLIPEGQKGTALFSIETNQLMDGSYELGANIFRGKSGAHEPVDEVLGVLRFQVIAGRHLDRGVFVCPGTWSIK